MSINHITKEEAASRAEQFNPAAQKQKNTLDSVFTEVSMAARNGKFSTTVTIPTEYLETVTEALKFNGFTVTVLNGEKLEINWSK